MSILQTSVRAAYQAEESKKTASVNRQLLSLVPMAFGSNAVIRLIPKADESDLPFVTRWDISLRFEGKINSDQDTTNQVTVKVPSMKTWGLDDYIIKTTQPYWRGSKDEIDLIARPYYHRPTNYYGCLVVSLPFVEQFPSDNPVRILPVTRQLQDQIVTTGINNVDCEYAMWDYDHGHDLVVRKVQQGQWPNYSSSSFNFKERPLRPEERKAIEVNGLPDLQAMIGEVPDAETQAQIKAMFHASLDGEPFDNKQWGGKFRASSWEKGDSVKRGGASEADTAETAEATAAIQRALAGRNRSTIGAGK